MRLYEFVLPVIVGDSIGTYILPQNFNVLVGIWPVLLMSGTQSVEDLMNGRKNLKYIPMYFG